MKRISARPHVLRTRAAHPYRSLCEPVDGFHCTSHFVRIVGIHQHHKMKIAIADLPHDRCQQPGFRYVGFGLDDAVESG
jgi:hypothetical protein